MIARDGEGRVLLVRHSYGPEGWHLPGGGLQRGEDPGDAAVRELAEETGCRAEGLVLVGRLEETLSGSPHTAHLFACTTRDPPQIDGREIAEARFFTIDTLPDSLGHRTKARLGMWRARERA
ncbi:NUDIX domain-containing protein [Qipengyuania sp. MTN3-11]|uniref:NUDIX domain-containing protein n=1 Tax=Qipengyuania sp. MTN3-11 TaxID=3056557 RepID=UPI0036F3C434